MFNLRPRWPALLDKLKAELGDLNELQLAGAIGLSQSMLSQVRIGHRPLPTKAKIAVLDKLGYALTRNLVLSTLPGDVAEAIGDADNRRAKDRARLRTCMEFVDREFDLLAGHKKTKFIDALCENAECDRKTLAAALQLLPRELREIEQGTRQLPLWSKTAVFEHFDAPALSDLICAIASE